MMIPKLNLFAVKGYTHHDDTILHSREANTVVVGFAYALVANKKINVNVR